ncbi:uncharacterized protein LOC133187706 [Saccostrea echinata]|uniref:uncharacterized protein LOC133187706 n=1 Tax=Saccostrea echinata TaxID=191078 RepID=UPI002A7F7D2A|nr:uncharacterized protein LOC133187706 [Saccostrea echinata]
MCYRPVSYCHNGYICTRWKKYTQCRPPYTGQNCKEIVRDACYFMPCQNGGTCTNTENFYTCTCNKGWSGQNCTDFTGTFEYEYNMLIVWNQASRNIESKSIYLTTNTSTTVEISTSENLNASLKNDIDQTIFFTSELKVALPAEMQGVILQKESKAVKIRSTDPVTVLLLGNDPSEPDDGSLIFQVKDRPTELMSYFYIIPSTVPRIVSNTAYSTVFGVVALKDSTTLHIQFQMLDKGTPITINGQEYGHLDVFSTSLNSMETLQIGHNTDLTGTVILSYLKPVAVFTGSGRNFSPDSPGSHVMGQLHPIIDWGSIFIVPPDFRSNGTFIRIIAILGNDRAVNISNGASTDNVVIGKYTPYEMNTLADETTVIISDPDYPLQVINYVRQDSSPDSGTPYMVNIPGVQHYKSQYQVPIPDGYLNSYITVMIRNNTTEDLRLNDQAISPDMVRFESKVLVKSIEYSILTVEVSPGILNIESKTDSPFGLLVRGYGNSDVYGFTGNVVDP